MHYQVEPEPLYIAAPDAHEACQRAASVLGIDRPWRFVAIPWWARYLGPLGRLFRRTYLVPPTSADL